MSLLDSLFGIHKVYQDGVEAVTRKALDFVGGFIVTDDPATGRTKISVAALAGFAYFNAWATGTYPIWAATTWTPVHTVVTLVDGLNDRVTRSDSDFTFEDAGKYRVEVIAYFINSLANIMLAFRFRNVAGGVTAAMGVGHSQVSNVPAQVRICWVIDVAAGQTLQLQYARGSGSHATNAGGTIDSETIRTFHLSIARIR
jgi:hypothetical protein